MRLQVAAVQVGVVAMVAAGVYSLFQALKQ